MLDIGQQKKFLVTYKIKNEKFLVERKDVIHKTKVSRIKPLGWSRYIFVRREKRNLRHDERKFLQNDNNGLHANCLGCFRGTLTHGYEQDLDFLFHCVYLLNYGAQLDDFSIRGLLRRTSQGLLVLAPSITIAFDIAHLVP